MVKKKARYRADADVAAAYGLKWIADHEMFCGLWINIPRIRFQRAAEVAMGNAIASSSKELPVEFFDGLARFEFEAEEMAFAVNCERSTQAALDKVRMG